MIKILFSEPNTPGWIEWKKEAKKEIRSIIKNGPPFEINDKLYKKQREAIFEAYFKKCAYCEGNFRLVESGDVEHFRPKGAVKDVDGKFVYIGTGKLKRKHPGYYWLAYEPLNLLPSCSLCNRSGKGNLFPVEGFRAEKPGDEKKEKPLLLHPGIGKLDPEKHFVLDPTLGILGGTTPESRMSIDVFKLNRDELLKARIGAYSQVKIAFRTILNDYLNRGEDYKQSLSLIQSHKEGRAAYSLAGRRALKDCKKGLLDLFQTLY